MTAFLILNYDVRDQQKLEEYREVAGPALLDDPTQVVVSTDATIHLGEAPAAGTHTVMLRFESVAVALDRYNSGAYQDVVGRRWAATRPRVAMVVPSAQERS